MHEPVALAPLPSEAEPREGAAGAGPCWGAGGSGGPGLGCRSCGGATVPLCQHGGVLAEAEPGGTLWDAGGSHPHMPGCWAAESSHCSSFPIPALTCSLFLILIKTKASGNAAAPAKERDLT